MDIVEATKLASPRSFVRHPWEQARAEIVVDLLSPIVSDGAKVLDYGCGDGFVLSQIERRLRLKTCIGYDPALTESVKAHLPVDPQSQVFRDILDCGDGFDIALMLDVLEHCDDESLTLREVSGRLTPQGHIVITVPAFQFLFSDHDKNLGHRRRYSLSQLRRVVEAAGFNIQRSGYVFQSLLVVRAFQKLTGLWTESLQVNQWTRGPKITGSIKSILMVEYWIFSLAARLGLKVPGLSCLVVGQKKRGVD